MPCLYNVFLLYKYWQHEMVETLLQSNTSTLQCLARGVQRKANNKGGGLQEPQLGKLKRSTLSLSLCSRQALDKHDLVEDPGTPPRVCHSFTSLHVPGTHAIHSLTRPSHPPCYRAQAMSSNLGERGTRWSTTLRPKRKTIWLHGDGQQRPM